VFKIGAIDNVLTGEKRALTWDDYYPLAQSLGFEGIELGVGADYDQTQLWDKAGRARLRNLAEQTGVVTASICLHSYWSYSFANPDPAIQARAGRIAREAAEIAAELGARHILIPLTCPVGIEEETAQARWIEGIRACVGAAEACGVVFDLENVGRSFGNTAQQILAMVEAIDSPAVAVYYDPGNAVATGLDPQEGIETLGSHIGQAHVKEIGGKLLGQGRVPWPQLLATFKKVGYEGWLVLETDPTDDPKAAALANLTTLRQLIEAEAGD
jgi:sugar phosphate isomerase/epimerase